VVGTGLRAIGVGLSLVGKRCGTTARAEFCLSSLNCSERSSAAEFVTCKNMTVFLRAYFYNCTQHNKSGPQVECIHYREAQILSAVSVQLLRRCRVL
jgi:hypothetical protein